MPFINDEVFDQGLDYADTNGTRVDICTQEPTTYTEATSTYTIANKTGVNTGAPEDGGSVGGRVVVVPAIEDGDVTSSGTGTHWALTNGTDTLIAAGPLLAPRSLTSGNKFNLAAIAIAIYETGAIGEAAVIDGTGQIGQQLWAEGTAPFQWQRDGVNISGATAQSYTVQEADDGAEITVVDASGLASNAITATWVYCRADGTRIHVDIDRENDRYWFDGLEYNRTAFEALDWVPSLTSGLINTEWTANSLPFPDFDAAIISVICHHATTDNDTPNAIVGFNDGSATERAMFQVRWDQATPLVRMVVSGGGQTNQVLLNGLPADAIVSGTEYRTAAQFQADAFWLVGAGQPSFDAAGNMPTGVDRMHIGRNEAGTQTNTGAINRVAVHNEFLSLHEVQMMMGYDVMTFGVMADSDNDGVDSADIFGDGFPALVNSYQNGKIDLYRQQVRGVFTRTMPKASALASAKVEGVVFCRPFPGDDFYRIVVVDQDLDEIRLYAPTTPGDYEQTDWTPTTIASSKDQMQDIVAIRVSGDDRDTLVYSYEGTTGGVGGWGKLRWNGSSWDDTLLEQVNGAWAIGAERFDNGDLLVGARDGANPGAVGGIFRLTLAGTLSNINTDAHDWLRVAKGDFFGNGNEDVVANHITGSTEAFSLFDASDSFAETVVNHTVDTAPTAGDQRNWGVHNLNYQINGRDVILQICVGKASVWAWDGVSAWEPIKVFGPLPTDFKADDTIARMRITRRLQPDIVLSDNVSHRLMIFALD